MNGSQTHLVPVLSSEGHAIARSATGTLPPAVQAVLDGRDFLDELEDGADAAGLLAGVPFAGAYSYRWIVIDLGLASPARRAAVRDGALAANRHRRGLVICSGWNAAAGTADDGTAKDQVAVDQIHGLHLPTNVVQYVRFLLRTLPATRVLFASALETVLFADALAGHEIVLGCEDEDIQTLRGGKATRRAAWIPELLYESDDLPHALDLLHRRARSQDTAIACSQATAILVGSDCGEVATALRCAPRAAIATHVAGAVENVLVRGTRPQPILPGKPPEGVIRVEPQSDVDRDAAPERVLFACLHLLGDTLAATPVIRSYRESHPDSHISVLVPDSAHARVLELCPHIDALLFLPLSQHQIVYSPSTPFVDSMAFGEHAFDRRIVLDIQAVAAARKPDRHMTEGYSDLTGIPISSRRPALDPERARRHARDLGFAERPIVLSQHSVSGLIGTDGDHTKRWATKNWQQLASRLKKEFNLPIVSIGTPGEAPLASKHAFDLHCLSIHEAAALLADAALLITVDNGIYHLAQGLRTPTVHLYPDWLNAHWTACDPEGPHTDLRGDLRRIRVSTVFDAAAERLQASDVVGRA